MKLSEILKVDNWLKVLSKLSMNINWAKNLVCYKVEETFKGKTN